MDVHRCRFVPYPASAINALAFSHSSLPSSKPSSATKNLQVRLAIGRANGDIEIWNPLQSLWHQELVIRGGRDRSIDGLVWATDPDEKLVNGTLLCGRSRLFSIGYTSTVTEWDLEKARAKTHASGQHGEIWCFGIQPLPNNSTSNEPRTLVAGTNDGSLVVYSTEDNDLKFQRILARAYNKKVKMVSIAFQSRNVVAVGCSDSTILVYDVRNGTLVRRMTLGSDLSGATGPRSKNIIVWALKCLRNGDFVSGDSTGQLCIWDGKTYTLAQRVAGHKQDILSLAVSADGSRIVSGGMDQRIALYEPSPGQFSRWSKIFHRKHHTHDVKAMASFEGMGMSVLVSGGSCLPDSQSIQPLAWELLTLKLTGPDASPVLSPLREAGRQYHRILAHLPHDQPLRSAPKARLIVSWWGVEVSIWQLTKASHELLDTASGHFHLRKNRKLVAQILVKGESSITSAAISEDGALLVVSTALDVKAFQLDLSLSNPDKAKFKKVHVPVPASGVGATRVEISPDKTWVCWVSEGSQVFISRASTSASSCSFSQPMPLRRLHRQIPKHLRLGGLGAYDRNVSQLSFSPNSKMLAVSDLAGYIDTWVLRGPAEHHGVGGTDDDAGTDESASDSSEEEANEHSNLGEEGQWIRNPKASLILKIPSAPVVLSFFPQQQQQSGGLTEGESEDCKLLVLTLKKDILIFHPLQGKLAEWSRRNQWASLPETFRTVMDLVKGVIWQGPTRAWVYGVSFLFMLDFGSELCDSASDAARAALQRAKDEPKHCIKRKRDRYHESGAGGPMDKKPSLAPRTVRIPATDDAGAPTGQWVDVDMTAAAGAENAKGSGTQSEVEADDEDDEDDDDDEDEEVEPSELQLLRRNGGLVQNGTGADTSAAGQDLVESSPRGARWWHTFQYRSILGIVPLSFSVEDEDGVDDKHNLLPDGHAAPPPLEIAIVERPAWELDLPLRYLGEGERDR